MEAGVSRLIDQDPRSAAGAPSGSGAERLPNARGEIR
jgi:hypothetical protein